MRRRRKARRTRNDLLGHLAGDGIVILNSEEPVFLNPRILNCDNPEVRMDAKEIQYNVPEFMLPGA